MDDFDWDRGPDVVIADARGVAVYLNRAGELTIRQRGGSGERDAIVSLARSDIARLAEALIKHMPLGGA